MSYECCNIYFFFTSVTCTDDYRVKENKTCFCEFNLISRDNV